VWGIFHLIKQINGNNAMALLGAWSLSFSPLFFYYTINPMPDNAALCFSIWGMFFFFKHLRSKKTAAFVISNLLFSLAALSKLPYILFYSPMLLYLFHILLKKTQSPKALWQMILISLIIFAPNIIWYSYSMEFLSNNVVFTGIFKNSPDPYKFIEYLTGTLISVFPELLINYAALLFFFSAVYYMYQRKKKKHPFFTYFFITVLILILYYFYEINTIELSHDYYLMPFLPVLIIIIAYGSSTMLNKQRIFLKTLTIILLILMPLAAYLRIMPRWDRENPGFNKDILIYRNDLQKAIPDEGLCLAGHENTSVVFHYYLNKSGIVFDQNTFSKDFFMQALEKGIEYCYSDSRSVDDSIRNYQAIDSIIDTFGSVVVYQLKKYPHAD
jgi:4-amino-4-deoxy-L-arabinose transferase-like glycosyltransferase